MAGLITFTTNSQLDAAEAARREAEAAQQAPLIVGLAAHLRSLWEPAKDAKSDIETVMIDSMRQRKGEYDAQKLTEITAQGGSRVFMMVTETKCRGAESWLRDVLLEEGVIPFDVHPTPKPSLSPEETEEVNKRFADMVIQTIQQSGVAPDSYEADELREIAEDDVKRELLAEGEECAERMRVVIADQFAEGGMVEGFNEFISDLTTYPNAFLKGPVVRRRKQMAWVRDPVTGVVAPSVTEALVPTYNRVDPFRVYPEPGISCLQEGYLFEHHRLSRPELADLIGCPGYDDNAIRAVLEHMPYGGMSNWVNSKELQKNELENKTNAWNRPTEIVDALEFWGKIPGRKLIEWGMTEQEVPDPDKEYDVNAWLIDRWVIKAVLNYDPLGHKNYYTSSFFKRPGSLWGAGIPEIISDIQQMCNAAARALANNMGLASGPLVEINVERLAGDEKITTLTPWQIYQTVNDPMGSGQPAVRFNQPDDRSQPLMMVYQHFLKLADDQSGIPAYVYGDMNVGGAGRTASGLSMLMGSAGKGIRQVIMHIDRDVISPAVTAQYNWNMRYVDDESIKGDSMVVATGALVLATREQQNVRRMEFLQMTANEFDMEIVGKTGRGAILRETAKGLSMPADEIVPSKDKLEIMDKLAAQQKAMEQQAGPQPQANVQFQRGPNGEVQGANVFPGGQRRGGQEANTVSNQNTGRAA